MTRAIESQAAFRPLKTFSRSFLIAMGDGDGLVAHRDSGGYAGAKLELIYLFYFYRSPKRFSGGELVLTWPDGEEVIEPRNNALIVIPGDILHAVRPVSCPSKDVRDCCQRNKGRRFNPALIVQAFDDLISHVDRRISE
jgi:hypothetical protein